MDIEAVRKRGIDEINTAIEFDQKHMYEDALNHYIRGIGTLMASIKYTKNEKLKRSILVKIVGYFDRAEVLKKSIHDKKEIKRPPSPQNEKRTSPTPVADTVDPAVSKMKEGMMNTMVSDTGVSFNDVIGIEQTKEALIEAVVLPRKFPSMFKGQRKPWNAILMYGPPGTGKSFLAKAVATEAKSKFFSVSSSDIMSKWQGESEKTIKTLFEVAREEKPSVIFIDEVDSLAGERGDGEQESTRRIKTQLLTEMQGVGSDNEGILILAATNTPWSLDSAFRRRFQKRIYVGLPDSQSRILMFKKGINSDSYINCDIEENEFRKLGELSEGYSGSDISNVIREALMVPIRKCRNAKQFVATGNGNKFTPVQVYPNCAKCPLDLSSNPSRGKVCDNCGAHCKIMEDLDDETLEVPPVTFNDIEISLKEMHKSVAENEMIRYSQWTLEFGQDGA
jgi:vacuolar protein-sorting-associated protein 4